MSEINTFIGQVSLHLFVLFIFFLIFTFIFGAMLNFLIIKYLKDKTAPAVYKSLSKLIMYGIYALGIYFAFKKIINFDITASLAALGILGVAIFLPMAPILQNIAAGFLLSIERPFREEDIIEVNGILCKVKDIMLRKTRLRALDGRIITLPNLVFMTTMPIINYSRGEFIRVTLNIDISSDSDKSKAKQIIEKACAENQNILPHIPEKKLTRVIKIFEVPKNFFVIPKNIKNLTPKIMTKSINK
ncbi:MAG: mechanosensitive ion channel domain-containing protein, partial [Nanoarchaeota archaeon]